eukprot:UN3044
MAAPQHNGVEGMLQKANGMKAQMSLHLQNDYIQALRRLPSRVCTENGSCVARNMQPCNWVVPTSALLSSTTLRKDALPGAGAGLG